MAKANSNRKRRAIAAVAYYRMSSKKQDKSISAQRAEVEKFAKSNGYQIIRWKPYLDEGISGSESEARAGFTRLIEDATTTGDFDVILVWDQDRFSRFDPMEANYYWYQLRQAGVRIVSVTQGELDWESLGGWLTASVTQHGKAQYLKDLSRNVLRGRLERAKQGRWTAGGVPFGYALNDGKVVLGEPRIVEAVRWLFETYAADTMTLHDIAHELEVQGIPTPSRKAEWSNRNLQHILRRDCYHLGRLRQFREGKGKFYSICGEIIADRNGATENEVRSDEECHHVDCPKIISNEVWERCRKVIERHRTQTAPRSSAGSKSVLSGLLVCGHCGKPMYASTSPKKEKRQPGGVMYTCSSYMRHGTRVCSRNGVRESALLDLLVDKIREKVLDPDELERLRTAIEKKLQQRAKPADTKQLDRLRANLTKLDDDVKAAAKQLKRTPDDLYDLAIDDLRELRAKRDEVATRLEAEEVDFKPRTKVTAETLDRTLKRLHTIREDISSGNPKMVKAAMRQIVDRIELSFTHTKGKRVQAKFERGIVRFNSSAELCGPAIRHG